MSDRDKRQADVFAWCKAAFTVEQSTSLPQRGLRLLEETIEAYQAAGPRESAYVELDGTRILTHRELPNLELLQVLRCSAPGGPLVVEMMAPYGRLVGREVFETLVWIGRYLEAWPGVSRTLERKDVKRSLGLRAGGRNAATDADVRRALIARWGGKAALGSKRAPGPLTGRRSSQAASAFLGKGHRCGLGPSQR